MADELHPSCENCERAAPATGSVEAAEWGAGLLMEINDPDQALLCPTCSNHQIPYLPLRKVLEAERERDPRQALYAANSRWLAERESQ
jgi:hypothetical protein